MDICSKYIQILPIISTVDVLSIDSFKANLSGAWRFVWVVAVNRLNLLINLSQAIS